MSEPSNLSNHFLIAMPSMQDPNFNRTVTYICEHNENGAIGFIINRPAELNLEHVFEQMQIKVKGDLLGQQPLMSGGPLQAERGFVIHSPVGEWRSSLQTGDNIAVTTSQDVLEAMAVGDGPDKVVVTLGYAGWGAAQLEQEILQNAWLSCPASEQILFELPFAKRWEAAAKEIGVDINSISDIVGHG